MDQAASNNSIASHDWIASHDSIASHLNPIIVVSSAGTFVVPKNFTISAGFTENGSPRILRYPV